MKQICIMKHMKICSLYINKNETKIYGHEKRDKTITNLNIKKGNINRT